MIIEKVKNLGENYLINNNLTVPKNNSNSVYREVEKWIENGGIVEPKFNDQELLNNAKKAKKEEINQQRDNNKNKDILFSINNKDYYFQRDIMSQLAFINAIVSSNDIAVSNWITSDNSIVKITKSDLISICAHIKQRDDDEYYQARKRKNVIDALESIEAIESYDITTVYK